MSDKVTIDWQERFRETADLVPGIICEIDLELNITYFNRLALETFGFNEADTAEPVRLLDLLHPEELERSQSNLGRILAGEKLGPQQYRLVAKNGTVGDFFVNSAPMVRDGEVIGMRACVLDISELKETERRLSESEARFRSIFAHAPIGVALFCDEGTLVEANEAFSQMFDLTAPFYTDREGVALSALVGELSQTARETLSGGETVKLETQRELPSDEEGRVTVRHLDWRLARLPGSGECRLLVQVEDVTERKLAEEKRLREAEALVEEMRREMRGSFTFYNMTSRSPQMRKIFSALPEIAAFPTTVLVCGESGTGKELIATCLHEASPRKGMPFVAVNCSALPDNLLESELFGYKKGAFTDAKQDKPGKFALAEGGTIFLDEIGDISMAMQVKLLRVLQQKTYEPLGGTTSIKADVRIVAATNRDLASMVRHGSFREDLYYRLNVVKITLPPLRERRCDIPLLTEGFIASFNRRYDKQIKDISSDSLDVLMTHEFPGNIRELENVIERAFIFCRGDRIEVEHLPEELTHIPARSSAPPMAATVQTPSSLEDLERNYILSVIEQAGGNKLEAARRLGMHKSTLFRKLKKLGIGSDD